MGKLEKYSSYKDSGVEWLGEIPENWKIEKLFGLCNFIRGNSSFSKDELLNNGKYVALQYGKTYKVDEVDEKYKFYVNDEFYKSSQIVNFGDTIFISTSETIEDLGHSAYYKRSDLGLLGGEQILLNSKVEIINSKYLYFSSKVFSKELQRFATGIKVFRFNINDLKTIYIPLPSQEEQTKIASFLDEKTSQIDKAISQKEKLIELLGERRQITINEAVTKGLDKAVEFKDSGVEWLGEIPEHWQTQKMKYLGKIFAGLTDKKGDDFSKEISEDKKPFIPFTNVCNNVKIDSNQMQYVKVKPYEKQNKVQKNDIIFLMSSETLDDIGKCSIHLDEEQIYLNSFCKGFRPKAFAVNAEFLNYLLQSKTYRNYFALVGRGFTRINIKQEYINDLFTVLPPKDEQIKIVEYIKTQTTKIDKAIELQQNYIAKLGEYKASLIDSVVTGKVRVA